MKTRVTKIAVLTAIVIIFCSQSHAGTYKFIDENRDGINDVFVDANGDGINDIDSKPYNKNFPFQDENNDGINDIFTDKDGDGVNDIKNKKYPVIDFDRDRINDITELPYHRKFYNGFRFGYIIEEKNIVIKDYLDKDHDGMHDKINNYYFRDRDGDGINDFFFDRNGDGFNDRIKMRRNRRKFSLPDRKPPGKPRSGKGHR